MKQKLFNLIMLLLCLISLSDCKTTNFDLSKLKLNEDIKLIGIIKKQKMYQGTLNEYTFYTIIIGENKTYFLNPKDENNIILFNTNKESKGFDEYVNKKVKITGKIEMGFVGWKKELKKGILVEKITIIK